MNVNPKEKIAQIYARKGTREAPARWRIPLLFLALLIPVVAGKLAAAEDQPGADSALVIDVYSGAIAPDATQEKAFWLWLETLKKTEEPGQGNLETVAVIWTPAVTKDQNGHSRFEVD
jgi:hypothetical protein